MLIPAALERHGCNGQGRISEEGGHLLKRRGRPNIEKGTREQLARIGVTRGAKEAKTCFSPNPRPRRQMGKKKKPTCRLPDGFAGGKRTLLVIRGKTAALRPVAVAPFSIPFHAAPPYESWQTKKF